MENKLHKASSEWTFTSRIRFETQYHSRMSTPMYRLLCLFLLNILLTDERIKQEPLCGNDDNDDECVRERVSDRSSQPRSARIHVPANERPVP